MATVNWRTEYEMAKNAYEMINRVSPFPSFERWLEEQPMWHEEKSREKKAQHETEVKVAELDQLKEKTEKRARYLSMYHDALLAEGFQADMITELLKIEAQKL
jgi:hypothetical protein